MPGGGGTFPGNLLGFEVLGFELLGSCGGDILADEAPPPAASLAHLTSVDFCVDAGRFNTLRVAGVAIAVDFGEVFGEGLAAAFAPCFGAALGGVGGLVLHFGVADVLFRFPFAAVGLDAPSASPPVSSAAPACGLPAVEEADGKLSNCCHNEPAALRRSPNSGAAPPLLLAAATGEGVRAKAEPHLPPGGGEAPAAASKRNERLRGLMLHPSL